MSNTPKIDDMIILKKKVNELVKLIQTQKNLLSQSKISLKQFKERKVVIEKELKWILKKIVQYNKLNPSVDPVNPVEPGEPVGSAKSTKNGLPPIRKLAHVKEKAPIEEHHQEKKILNINTITERIKKHIKEDPKQPPQESSPSKILPKEIKVKKTHPKEIVVKEIPHKETILTKDTFTVKDKVRKIENRASRIEKLPIKTKKPIKIEQGTAVKTRIKAIEARSHLKNQLKDPPQAIKEKDDDEPIKIWIDPKTTTPDTVIEPPKTAIELPETTELTERDIFVKRESQIANEVSELMFYYQTDFTNIITKAIVYLAITSEYHFMIEIDFTDYPKRPKLKIPSKIIELFIESGGEVFQNIPTLFNWDDNDPGKVYQVIAEIEYVLMKTYRTKTDKPEKVPIELNLIQSKLLEKFSSIVPPLKIIWHFLVIVMMVVVLSIGMSGITPAIPIIAFLVMIGVVYFNGNLEINFSFESFHPEVAPLESTQPANQTQEENSVLIGSADEISETVELGRPYDDSLDFKFYRDIFKKEGKIKVKRGHNLKNGMVDGDDGRERAHRQRSKKET